MIYLHHFGLSEEPFGVCPDPRFFLRTAQHCEAAATLYYAMVERRGFSALIAFPGLGKTSVITSLLARLREQAEVALIVEPSIKATTLIEMVLAGFGLDPDAHASRRNRQLSEFLENLQARNRTAIVIIDEAQNLDRNALEAVRMLSNFETPRQKLIQFILSGQPRLGTLLNTPACEQIRQRINTVARLNPLATEDVGSYITHRLRVGGCTRNLFTRRAIDEIARRSEGVPRNINTICFNALTLGFARETKIVDRDIITETVRDLSLTEFEMLPAVNSACAPATAMSVWDRLKAPFRHGARRSDDRDLITSQAN